MTLSKKSRKQIVWLRAEDELRLLNYLDTKVNIRLAENKYIELILIHAMRQKSLMRRINESINMYFDRDMIIENEFPGSKQHKRACCGSCDYRGYPTQDDLWAHRAACENYGKEYRSRLDKIMNQRIPQMEEFA